MKSILIDPYSRTVVMRHFRDVPDLPDIYEAIGERCYCVEAHSCRTLSGRDVFFCDENAFMYPEDRRRMFVLLGFLGGSITGRALVVGHTADGEMTAPVTTLQKIRSSVMFI